MAGRGGGPSRRSHTKSRKGCKTCKRRHIRCDETFPQCRNCTKHHVRCDYLDGPAAGDEDLQISTNTGLSWTPEIEKIVDAWQSTGRFPFAHLELSPFPDVKSMSKNEIRLLYHICAILDELKQSRTAKLSVWTDILPKCIAVAAEQNLALQAVFAFAASHMAWESQSTIARTIASEYISAAVKELRGSMTNFSRANADGVLSASLILSWLHNDWRVWAHEMSGLKTIIQVSQQFRPDTPFEEYLSSNPIDPLQAFTSLGTYPMTEQRQEDNMKTFQSIRSALQRLQLSVSQSPDDVKLVERMDLLIQSFVNAPVAETPKDQFERLYNMRKMLFWLPVNLLSTRKGDIHSLLVLSHYYATSLALENVFSDIGAPFLSVLVAPPLLEIINIIQTCQATQIQDPLAQTAAALMDFPRDALAQYQSRREWAQQQANMQAHASQQMANESQNFELINQFGELEMPPPSLSPAFASTTIHLTPPPMSARLSRPPFLEVPGNITEQFAYQSYTPTTPGFRTPTTPGFHTPTTTYLSSPMLSPAFPLEGDSASYHLPVPGYESRRISAEFGDLNVSTIGEYSMSPSSGVYQSNTGSIAGGCVGPTAVWT